MQPLAIAIEKGHPEVAKMLADAGSASASS
jgi:hypothetical protein